MLELVQNKYEKTEAKHINATDVNQSHLFIDSIIQNIKQAHSEDIWNSQLEELMSLVEQGNKRPTYLTAL